jgi:hypothetical protein
MDSNFSYRGTRAPNSEASQASRVALGPDRARLVAACTAVIAEAHCTAALCCLAHARLSTRNDEMADAVGDKLPASPGAIGRRQGRPGLQHTPRRSISVIGS